MFYLYLTIFSLTVFATEAVAREHPKDALAVRLLGYATALLLPVMVMLETYRVD